MKDGLGILFEVIMLLIFGYCVVISCKDIWQDAYNKGFAKCVELGSVKNEN